MYERFSGPLGKTCDLDPWIKTGVVLEHIIPRCQDPRNGLGRLA